MAKISLYLTRRILFSERTSDTPADVVGTPANGANISVPFLTGAEFLEQVKQLIRTEISGPSASLQYRNPFPDYVANSEWPKGYKPIKFTSFSGEGFEDAATHISRFQDENLKLRAFGSSLSGSALTWYTKLAPRSVPD